jgi:hypothetical protein
MQGHEAIRAIVGVYLSALPQKFARRIDIVTGSQRFLGEQIRLRSKSAAASGAGKILFRLRPTRWLGS